jgi:hypothetical protein
MTITKRIASAGSGTNTSRVDGSGTSMTTQRIASAGSGTNTSRVDGSGVQADTYNAWGESWRLGGSVESSWGLSWIHLFARSVIGVTDRVDSSSATTNNTKRVTL